jgi:hypothetical protein
VEKFEARLKNQQRIIVEIRLDNNSTNTPIKKIRFGLHYNSMKEEKKQLIRNF